MNSFFFLGNLIEKRKRGRTRRRWGDDIKFNLQEMGCGMLEWIILAQDTNRWWARVNSGRNIRVP